MIPFFVVDRPMSLNIIKTFFVKHPGVTFGLMSHALVSESFRTLYAKFPCDSSGCWLASKQPSVSCDCAVGSRDDLRRSVIKAVDYGIFSKGPSLPYPKLFDIYQRMGADLGIMKDVFGDSRRTLESAKRAVESYQRKPRSFRLVLVAQGNNVDDYLWCIERLIRLGVGELAIGGLLTRKLNSARYSSAGKLADIDNVLSAVRRAHPEHEVFVLGCYHPKRHHLFASRSVFASDYKGWIFNYEHRIDRVDKLHTELMKLEAEHGCSSELAKAARRRHNLASQTASERKAYAVTKNDGARNSALKAEHRTTLSELLRQLGQLDATLVRLRRSEIATRKLPSIYAQCLLAFEDALSHTDQEIRVAGVHEYLNRQVLPLMRLTPPAIDRRGFLTELKEEFADQCPGLLSDNLILPSAVRTVPLALPAHHIVANVASTGAD